MHWTAETAARRDAPGSAAIVRHPPALTQGGTNAKARWALHPSDAHRVSARTLRDRAHLRHHPLHLGRAVAADRELLDDWRRRDRRVAGRRVWVAGLAVGDTRHARAPRGNVARPGQRGRRHT